MAAPTWLVVTMLTIMGLVIIAGFGLTLYYLSAPRSTLKNLLGLKRGQPLHTPIGHRRASWRLRVQRSVGNDDNEQHDEHAIDDKTPALPDTPIESLLKALSTASDSVSANRETVNSTVLKLLESLSKASRVNKRTTRTTLAVTGFAFLGLLAVGVFGLSGQGVRDLRTAAVSAITTLVATIAGFYFGSQSAAKSAPGQSTSSTETASQTTAARTATLLVQVHGATNANEATISITAASGQTVPAEYIHGVPTVQGEATLTDLPPGNYTISATMGADTSPAVLVTMIAGTVGDRGSGTATLLTPAPPPAPAPGPAPPVE